MFMKPVVGIFAHPDDEVFVGPGGTFAQFAKEGRETYIICATDGEAGMNSGDQKGNLGEIRREEMRASAKLLGVKEIFFLGYKDGSLSNSLYHEVADKIDEIVKKIDPEIIITMDPRGISGHLDHIAISMISSFVFEKIQSVKEIWYYVLTEQGRALQPPYFIYFPPGYKKSEIDKIVDITAFWDLKLEAMRQHKSQAHDIARIESIMKQLPQEEYFIVTKKSTKDTE
jgi:LmbE family N-acetylglucosaminyl deacetylase